MSDELLQFYSEMAEILEVELDQINPDFSLVDGSWDSLAVLSTMAAIDDIFDRSISGDALYDCSTIGDILSVLPDNTKT